MSTITATPREWSARQLTAVPARALPLALARLEAVRLLRHPITLLGFALWLMNAVLSVVNDQGPRPAFESVSMMLAFFPGMFLILSANLVASRDHRADSRELLAPLPGRPQERVLALVLASFVPALIGLGLATALHLVHLFAGDYDRVFGIDVTWSSSVPSVWHLVGGAVPLLGACLFGTMLAMWAPWRGAAVVGLVAMVAASVAVESVENGTMFGAATSWARWGMLSDRWAGLIPGSPAWHVLYLIGLCGLAAAAALLRVTERRTSFVLLGISSVAATVVGAIGQLP